MANSVLTITSPIFPKPVPITIEFSIKNFQSLKGHTEIVCSDWFTFGPSVSSWGIAVAFNPYPEAIVDIAPNFVSAYLHRQSVSPDPFLQDTEPHAKATQDKWDVIVDCVFGVVNNDSTEKELLPKFTRKAQTVHVVHGQLDNDQMLLGVPQWIPHTEIWGDNSTLHFTIDILTIRVDILCTVLEPGRKKCQPPLADVLLQRNMDMYSSDIGRDFVLVSSDGEERRVHKVVLSCASRVFHAMFEANLDECRTGRCEITDVDGTTLDGLLRFMYYGGVDDVSNNARNLFDAAEKYELHHLKHKCEEDLIGSITVDNAADLLLHADKMSAPALKAAALKYLAANSLTEPVNPGTVKALLKDVFATGNVDLIAQVFAAVFDYLTSD